MEIEGNKANDEIRNINPGYAQISYGTSDKLYKIILFNGSITITLIIIGNKKVVERVETNLLRQSQYLLLISAFINLIPFQQIQNQVNLSNLIFLDLNLLFQAS